MKDYRSANGAAISQPGATALSIIHNSVTLTCPIENANGVLPTKPRGAAKRPPWVDIDLFFNTVGVAAVPYLFSKKIPN
jgi:hypothetical protein